MKSVTVRAFAVAVLSMVCTVSAAAGHAHTPFRRVPAPGVRHYQYTVVQTADGKVQSAYRTAFDLRAGRSGAVLAVITKAEEGDGAAWKTVSAEAACRRAMNAPAGGLATVKLWPITPEAARSLGPSFLDACAPGGVFFPLTDILNTVVITASDGFNVGALKAAGDSAAFPGFSASFERDGQAMKETADGGQVRLVSLDRGRAVIDWAPNAAVIDLDQTSPDGQPLHLHGTEHWAFRLELEARTGVLLRAETLYDDLELRPRLVGMPEDQTPLLKITRMVKFERAK